MGKISIIVPHLSGSDLNLEVVNTFESLNKEGTHDFCIFYENDTMPFFKFPVAKMSFGRIWQDQSNDGIIIATTLNSAKIISKLPNRQRKVLYLWDLEFMWNKLNYIENLNTLHSIEVYTKNDIYKKLIENYGNINVKSATLKEMITCQK